MISPVGDDFNPITHPLIHESGVFFGLPEPEYHAAFALSASGIKYIRISTLDFWARSPLNPEPDDEEDGEAMRLGTAWHKRVLEGRDAFYEQYAAAVDPADYPDTLRTIGDIKAAIERAGGPVKGVASLKKADLIDKLREYDPGARVWEQITAEHAARHIGKKFLSATFIHKIETSARMIEAHPVLSKAFTGGYPEVSVFWRDAKTGIPMKVRFDYLKVRAISDLKTFQNVIGAPVNRAVCRAIANGRLHIQAGVYLQAGEVARELIRDGAVFGEVDPAFLRAFATANELTWLWVFLQKGPAAVARGYVLPPGITMDLARHEVSEAKRLFSQCWETFGPDLPWVDQADIYTIDSTDLPSYIAE